LLPASSRRLKRIQDLVPADVQAALSKLPSDVSPACTSLLRSILCIAPAQRLSLADIMADPWFTQFLPDLSKLAVAQPREQQSVEEITRILAVGRGTGLACTSGC
jgi:serine/threonine protein kinase